MIGVVMRLSLAVFVLWGMPLFHAGAEEEAAFPLVNKLGFRLAFIRTDSPGGRLEPVATDVADGATVMLGDAARIDLAWRNDGAFDGMWHAGMWHGGKTADAEKGFAERYFLKDDGTFVHAPSERGEFERELFKTGTWTVTDNELRLTVRERWVVPVGGAENIDPDDAAAVVVGDAVKVLCNPPETEILPIARAEADPGTGRKAITIDGAMFYEFDGQAKLLKKYNELRVAQKFDFSSLTGVIFMYASGAGAWRTLAAIRPDGTFGGQYSDANMGEQGAGYPGGTIYVSNFSGAFSPPEKADEAGYAYKVKCVNVSREGTPDEERIIDGIRYVNSEPFGFENAAGKNDCTLFVPGTPLDKLPESFARAEGMELEDGEIPVLDEYVLYIPPDSPEDSDYVFFRGIPGDGSDCRMHEIDWAWSGTISRPPTARTPSTGISDVRHDVGRAGGASPGNRVRRAEGAGGSGSGDA